MTTFRRIRGRIVPIKSSQNANAFRVGMVAGKVTKVAEASAPFLIKKQQVKPHFGLQAVGFGASVASGLLSGATFFSGGKKFWASQAASIGLDIGSTAANVASFAGKGHLKERAKGAARQEGINLIAGYAAMGGALLANPKARSIIKAGALRVSKFVGKVIL